MTSVPKFLFRLSIPLEVISGLDLARIIQPKNRIRAAYRILAVVGSRISEKLKCYYYL